MHLRKAHYMCGWDWGACLPDGGIFRPVTLLGIETARLDLSFIHIFKKFLRPEQKFSSLEALKAQLERDAVKGQEYFETL